MRSPKLPVVFVLLTLAISSVNAEVLRVVTRVADRCVTLHWRTTSQDAEFHVARSTAPAGPFVELPSSPLTIQSFADLNVENGRSYYYRVTVERETNATVVAATPRPFQSDDEFLNFIEGAAFDYFWYEADANNGLVRDRSVLTSPCSVAAAGFGLTALGIGIDRGWIPRHEGAERALRILRTLATAPQHSGPEATSYKGWFYHFLDVRSLRPYRKCELSSVDTALLMAGVLYAQQYFNHEDEREIRSIATELFRRIDWSWMLDGGETLRMGWRPESGFIKARWRGYNEGSILYLLGLGAPEGGLERRNWDAWTETYLWRTNYGFSFIQFPPLFGHQYSACWIDYRDIDDEYTRAKGLTYFENSRRATLAQRAYAMANPKRFPAYGTNVWGLTACDGPAKFGVTGYAARGAPPPENDDGTLAPTAIAGSIAFAPAECGAALRHLYETYRERLICGYGFRDAFNLSVDWWDPDTLGIDQGPILIMIENYRSGSVWSVMKRSPVLAHGLERAGFRNISR